MAYIVIRGRDFGPGFAITILNISGPSSYDATNGFKIDMKNYGMAKVHYALAKIREAGAYQVEIVSISGSEITMRFYTIAADTTTGEISPTEVSNGTDLSSLTVELVVLGQ